MPEGEHQFVNITLAGARSPRAASKQGETSEPWADEVSRSWGLICTTWATNFLLGEILHGVASTSTRCESATPLTAHCNCHPISNQQQHCTGSREYIYWHRSVTFSRRLHIFWVHVDRLASSAPRWQYCRVPPRFRSRVLRRMALGHVGTLWRCGEPTRRGPRCQAKAPLFARKCRGTISHWQVIV